MRKKRCRIETRGIEVLRGHTLRDGKLIRRQINFLVCENSMD